MVTHRAAARAPRRRTAAPQELAEEDHQVPVPGDDFRPQDLAWLQRHYEELATHHRGQWIAIDGAALVATADNLQSLLAAAKRQGHAHPLVTAIPTAPILRLHVSTTDT